VVLAGPESKGLVRTFQKKSELLQRRSDMNTIKQTLDQSALKFNQTAIITFTLLGFIFNQPIFPAFVAVILIAGSINKKFALFKLTYAHVIKPLGFLKPDIVEDFPAPHEFAQLLGGIVLGTGSIFLYNGLSLAGWIFAWVVIILAVANLLFGFCAGCFVYYQLGKLGVPGIRAQVE
jgi:hypothetical protein